MLMGLFVSHKIFRSTWIMYYHLFHLLSNWLFFFILERRGGEQGKGPKENTQCFFFYLFNGLIYLLLSNGQVIWPVLDALQAVYAWALILSQYQVFLIALCKCPQLRGVQTAPVQERYILWSDIDYLKIDWHFQTCVLFFFGMTRVFHFNWKI